MSQSREDRRKVCEDMVNRPMAAAGLLSYRYLGRYGYIMIGARNDADALSEANRSLALKDAVIEKLEKWDGQQYSKVQKEM